MDLNKFRMQSLYGKENTDLNLRISKDRKSYGSDPGVM